MAFGVHSEVGRLRQVMVHRPGLEHARLTPSNAEELLFDDVLWVTKAKSEHDGFREVMRDRGVKVYETGVPMLSVQYRRAPEVSSQPDDGSFSNSHRPSSEGTFALTRPNGYLFSRWIEAKSPPRG